MCVALLYCVCVCTCERNTPARCISCRFVFCSNFIQANLPGNCVCLRPEGLHPCRVSALWKAVVALQRLFRARKHPSSSFQSGPRCVQQWQAGPARWWLCPGGGGGVSQPWRRELACVWLCCSGQAVVLLLLLRHVKPLCVSVPDWRRNRFLSLRKVNVKACTWLRPFWAGAFHLVT